MEELRAQKVEYLQKHIIDEGIDPQQFQDFCEQLKGEESDIDRWTLEEIVQLVNQFKLSTFNFEMPMDQTQDKNAPKWDQFELEFQTPDQYVEQSNSDKSLPTTTKSVQQPIQQQIQQTQQAQQTQQTQQALQTSQTKQNKSEVAALAQQQQDNPQINLPIVNLPKEDQGQKRGSIVDVDHQINCKKLGLNLFANKPLNIRIIGADIKQGGLFKSDYVTYQIQTNEFKVSRRFSDFLWLKSTLLKLFPGFGMPALADKTVQKTSSETIEKRRIMLEFFLQELGKIEVYRNSKYYVDFLRLQDIKLFKELQKFGEKLNRTTKFENLINMQGQIEFVQEVKTLNFESYLYQEEPIINKLKETFKLISKLLNQIQKLLQESQEQLQLLDQASIKHNIKSEYQNMKLFTQTLEIDIEKQNTETYQKIYNLFRFQTYNFSQIKNLIKLKSDLQNDLSSKKDIKIDKQIYDQNDQKRDELDIPSKYSKILAQQVGFVNGRIVKEIDVFINNRNECFKEQFKLEQK